MDQGVIHGNDDGSFAPNRQLNRAEVSKVIVLASGVELDTSGGPHFPDVSRNAWYYDYIETMYNQGWINGYPDGYFRPAVGINRAEIGKMAVNAFEIDQDLSGAPHFDDVSASDWFYGYVETAYNNGLMRGYGDGSFGPANPVTRAETVKIVYDSQLVVAEPEGPTEGTLEVMLSDDTPRGTNVPFNATSVPYTTFELTASDDSDVEVSSIIVTRLGLGDNDDFDNVWLEIDGFKIGNDRSINNEDIVELRFNPPIVVPAGQTLMADVVTSAKYSDTDKNLGHHNRLAIISADDVVSTAANVVGDFPLEGEEMEVADYEVSSVQFTTLGSDTTIDVGDNFIEIGKFRLLSSTASNKDIELRAITFKNNETAELEDDLENIALYVSGEQISAETILDGDYMTFRLDNGVTGGYIIEDGDSKIFSIRTDIVSAESGDKIEFKIDNYEDIVGVEIGTSFGIKATTGNTNVDGCTVGGNAEDSCAMLREYSIASGDLNVSRDPASLGNQNYAPGSNDIVFLTARVVVDQPLIIDGLTVDVADVNDGNSDGSIDTVAELNSTFDNFRFYLNDRLVDSENDFSGSTVAAAYLDFNTTFEIAGTSIIKIVGNIASGADTGDEAKLEITNEAFSSPEYISTGDQVTTDQILGTAQGSYVEVQVSELSITRTDGISDGDKIVAGVDDVEFMKFVLDNNDSGDVNVTSLSIAGTATGKGRTYTNFTSAVFVDGTQQGSAKNLSSAGVATFNDLSVIVPSSTQKEFVIVVDTIEASATMYNETLGDPVGCTAGTPNQSFDNSAGSDTLLFLIDSTVSTELSENIVTNDKLYIDGVETATITVGDADTGCTNYKLVTIAEGAPGNLGNLTLANVGSVYLKNELKLEVTSVDADNIDNGDSVVAIDSDGNEIRSECLNAGCTTSDLEGANFELVQAGRLSIAIGTKVESDILLAESNNVEVLKLEFQASDDEVHISDLYLENDWNDDDTADSTNKFEDRVNFKLFNASGQLIQEKTMTNGTLHFELGNLDRIRVPKDKTTSVTVKVDVKDINQSSETGSKLRLVLDTNHADDHKGIEAVTAATGSDITTPADGWGDVEGNYFVAYRTQMSINHDSFTSTVDATGGESPFHRIKVSADNAGKIEVKSLAVTVDTLSMYNTDGVAPVAPATTYAAENFVATDFGISRVKGTGTETVTHTPTLVTGSTASSTHAELVFTFAEPEIITAGDSESYELYFTGDQDLRVTGSATSTDDGVQVDITTDSVYSGPTTSTRQATAYTGTATGPGTDTDAQMVVSTADAAKFVEGDRVDFTDADDGSANATGIYITDIEGTTITLGTDIGEAIAAADTIAKSIYTVIWSDASGASGETNDFLNGYEVDINESAETNK